MITMPEGMQLTRVAKIRLFREDQYKFSPPDTYHAWWSADDWVNWIDLNGIWLTKSLRMSDTGMVGRQYLEDKP